MVSARQGATAPQRQGGKPSGKVGNMAAKTNEQLIADVMGGETALVTPKAAAAFLGCHERTVTRMCEQGKLKAVKVMSMWRVNRRALLDFAGVEA